MYTGQMVFSQLMDFLPKHEFDKCVRRYQGNYRMRKFSCLDQFRCMAFAQLTYRESLRDIETCLRAMGTKLYHAGFRIKVARNTLAVANAKRDWRIYADFAQVLIRIARKLYAEDPLGVELEQTAYALDSSTIDLCLSLFPWARFRKQKAAIKLHTLLDLRGSIPSFIRITEGKVHDVNILDELVPEASAFYIMDRGYIDFRRLYGFTLSFAFFVIRSKRNLDFSRRSYRPVEKSTGLRSDQTIRLSQDLPGLSTHQLFRCGDPKKIRFSHQQLHPSSPDHRPAVQMPLASGTLLQMDQTAPSHQGFLRYVRERGQNPSLDRHQCLHTGSILKKELALERSLSEILQICSITLFEKVPISEVLRKIILHAIVVTN